MTRLAVLVPVLNRPHRVKPLLEAFAASTAVRHRVYFIPDPDDHAEREAIAEAGGRMLCFLAGGYAAKVNRAVRLTDEPLLFLAADDLEPQPGWFEAARKLLAGGVQVVGVNDGIARRPERVGHATHFLMTRSYAGLPTIDGRPGPLCELYAHNFVDDELIATAQARGAYAYAEGSHVTHRHPMNQTAPDDAVYRKGRATFRDDRRRFRGRRRLFAQRGSR